MRVFRALIFLLFFTAGAVDAAPSTVDRDQFYPGAKWVWSYAEWDSEQEKWGAPYLYETYEVTVVDQGRVTIEMSSASQPGLSMEPHHKFVADLDRCLELGESLKSFRRFRIQFYTKSFGDQWELLSKHHKGLAFTEKFNCFTGDRDHLVQSIPVLNQSIDSFQWLQFPVRSWYSMDSVVATGVMTERQTKNYLVRLYLAQ